MRVIVVGFGMTGARFCTELAALAPDAEVTVLAAEAGQVTNRPLLTDLIAGRTDPALLDLDPVLPRHWQVWRGTACVAVDVGNRTVTDADGQEHPFDHLVLATGAEPRGLDGVTGSRPLVLRSRTDADRILEHSDDRRVVVVGAGLLGVEVACALQMAGRRVQLVERERQVLPGWLDADSAAILASCLRDLGVGVHLGVDDHTTVAGDLVIACVGVRARTHLARVAGLEVDRGVLTDGNAATGVEGVWAIGDCARRRGEEWRPMLDEGWDAAARLARRLAGRPVAGGPWPQVVRLRAPGLDVGFLGRTRLDGWDGGTVDKGRTVTLLDPDGRRAVRLVVRSGRLTGATAVGAGDVFGDLALVHLRGLPIPADPAHLLARGEVAIPPCDVDASGPWTPTICRCNRVTADDISDAYAAGAVDIGAIATATRATTGCGGCTEAVCSLLAVLRSPADEAV